MSKEWRIALPDIDEKVWEMCKIATPIHKMPNCPLCGHDELGLMSPGEAFCYLCGITVRDLTPEEKLNPKR